MQRVRLTLLLLCAVALCGCAAFGVPESADPQAKLRYAVELYDRQDRPLPAERLIRQAITIYEERNDELGLADGYRTYAFFFSSPSIHRWGRHYVEQGFLDPSATFEQRFERSVEYFAKARAIYLAHERFDALANIDLNTGFAHAADGQRAAACRAFDRSLESHRENIRRNPDTKVVLPRGFSTYEEYLTDRKRRNDCA